jgi:hypothetical protein
MYSQFEDRLRELLQKASDKDREGIEYVLHLLAENMQSSNDIESIKRYLTKRLSRKRPTSRKEDFSFLDLRNQLVHKGHSSELRVNILKYERLIWEILPGIPSFDDPNAMRNLLAYVMNRSISSENERLTKEIIVKEYHQLYKILPKRQRERVLFELARRIFGEISRTELEELIQRINQRQQILFRT